MAELVGYILTLDALFTWGIASLVYKFGLGKVESKPSILFRLICVSCWTFLLCLLFGSLSSIFLLNTINLLGFLIACLISGFSVTIGDFLYFTSLEKIDVSRVYPLTQLSLIFVYPFAIILFGDELKISLFFGGLLILSSVFFLSSKDKPNSNEVNPEKEKKEAKNLFLGVVLAIGVAFFWGLAIVAFNYVTKNITNDVFTTNFVRVFFGTILFLIIGIFRKDFYSSFSKENRKKIRYFIYIGIAGALSLGLADTLFYKAVEINGLVLTSTFTATTPMVQQSLSILILKEKFRKRFIIAVSLIIIGNYIILFL